MLIKPNRREFLQYSGLSAGAAGFLARQARGQVRVPGPGGSAPIGGGGGGGITPINHIAGPSTLSSSGGSATMDTSGANFLVAVVSNWGNIPVVSDSKNGATWTPLTPYGYSGGDAVTIYYLANPSVGTGHTFMVSGSGTFPGFVVLAFSGMVTSSVFDVGTDQGTRNSTYVPSTTPSAGNRLLIASFECGNVLSGMTVNSGFIPADSIATSSFSQQYGAGTTVGVFAAYLVVTGGGGSTAYAPVWTPTGLSGNYAHGTATFKGV